MHPETQESKKTKKYRSPQEQVPGDHLMVPVVHKSHESHDTQTDIRNPEKAHPPKKKDKDGDKFREQDREKEEDEETPEPEQKPRFIPNDISPRGNSKRRKRK